MEQTHRPTNPDQEGVIQGEYEKLTSTRDPYLRRARDVSKLTLPYLVPEEGDQSSAALKTPYQSIGARGINNLANKLLIALLPPNQPFFRLLPDPSQVRMAKEEDPELVSKVEKALGEIERNAMREVESGNLRATVYETLRHLEVAGNALLYLEGSSKARMYPLSQYVVVRDFMGNLLKVLIKETLSHESLPERVRNIVPTQESPDKNLDLYTRIALEGERWTFRQELLGIDVTADSNAGWKKDECPYLALRWNKIDGEDYGRGIGEDLMGDLLTAEGLSQALVEAAALLAQVKFGVHPNGTTRAEDITQCENGGVFSGIEDEVFVLSADKYGDLNVTMQTLAKIEETLSRAFLLSSVVRDADRVTAEEIRFLAQELEAGLGGVYSTQSQDLQLPLVRTILATMVKDGKIKNLPKDSVKPVIVTGMDAIGRGNDLSKLDTYVAGIAQILGPEFVPQYLNVSEYLRRRGTALALDTDGLVKTEDQVAQQEQQKQQQALAERAAPQVVQQVGQAVQGAAGG